VAQAFKSMDHVYTGHQHVSYRTEQFLDNPTFCKILGYGQM